MQGSHPRACCAPSVTELHIHLLRPSLPQRGAAAQHSSPEPRLLQSHWGEQALLWQGWHSPQRPLRALSRGQGGLAAPPPAELSSGSQKPHLPAQRGPRGSPRHPGALHEGGKGNEPEQIPHPGKQLWHLGVASDLQQLPLPGPVKPGGAVAQPWAGERGQRQGRAVCSQSSVSPARTGALSTCGCCGHGCCPTTHSPPAAKQPRVRSQRVSGRMEWQWQRCRDGELSRARDVSVGKQPAAWHLSHSPWGPAGPSAEAGDGQCWERRRPPRAVAVPRPPAAAPSFLPGSGRSVGAEGPWVCTGRPQPAPGSWHGPAPLPPGAQRALPTCCRSRAGLGVPAASRAVPVARGPWPAAVAVPGGRARLPPAARECPSSVPAVGAR